jgi:hypothetical protein
MTFSKGNVFQGLKSWLTTRSTRCAFGTDRPDLIGSAEQPVLLADRDERIAFSTAGRWFSLRRWSARRYGWYGAAWSEYRSKNLHRTCATQSSPVTPSRTMAFCQRQPRTDSLLFYLPCNDEPHIIRFVRTMQVKLQQSRRLLQGIDVDAGD